MEEGVSGLAEPPAAADASYPSAALPAAECPLAASPQLHPAVRRVHAPRMGLGAESAEGAV